MLKTINKVLAPARSPLVQKLKIRRGLDRQVISGEVAADRVFARGRKFELGPVAMR